VDVQLKEAVRELLALCDLVVDVVLKVEVGFSLLGLGDVGRYLLR